MSAVDVPARRLARLVLAVVGGRDAVEGLRALLFVTLASTVVTSAFYGYVGVWAVTRLHASSGQIGVMYAVNAVIGSFIGYIGGALSDRLGRGRIVVLCLGAQAVLILCCGFVGARPLVGLGLVVLASTAATPAWAIRNAFVGVLTPSDRRSQAFSSLRVCNNVGSVIGLPMVGLLLLVIDWPLVFVVLAVLGGVSAVVAHAALPSDTSGSGVAHIRGARRLAALRDAPFLVLLVSSLLAFVVYVAFASVLPINAVSSYHFPAYAWGFLVAINPVLVVACQGTLTRLVHRAQASTRIAAGALLMGLPWLMLVIVHSVAVVAALIVVFVVGEMLWSPATQAAASDFAPEGAQGAYLGAYGSSSSVGYALGPLFCLGIAHATGPGVMWGVVAAISVAAAAAGWWAPRLFAARSRLAGGSSAGT